MMVSNPQHLTISPRLVHGGAVDLIENWEYGILTYLTVAG